MLTEPGRLVFLSHGAKAQLITTDAPVGGIALDCGFYDQSAFTRAFREFMGTTPAEYRNQYAAASKAESAPENKGDGE